VSAPASLRDSQLQMASYLRDPLSAPPPGGVEARRLKVYRELVYNNVEGFISGGFPVLRSLYDEAQWEELVRAFLNGHRCSTPYFLEISQEFIEYLLETHKPRACDPPFMAELAHYEWVELALDVAETELPDAQEVDDIAAAVLSLSPLAWVLAYQYPVHRLGPGYRPDCAPETPTYLVVYRDREDEVRFMEINASTARLLELLRDNTADSVLELLQRLAAEMQVPMESIRDFAGEQLRDLLHRSVLVAV